MTSNNASECEPELLVESLPTQAGPSPGLWQASWRLTNWGSASLELLESWLPHGRFRAEAETLSPPLVLAPSESRSYSRLVRCDELPGTELENAFLIHRGVLAGQLWRILTQLRIEVSENGVPEPLPEHTTYHLVGFAL